MNAVDIIIISVIGISFIVALRATIKRRKNGGCGCSCSGDCSKCSGGNK